MNEFKFQITTFLLVALLAFGGYWAFTSLDRGITYTRDDVVVTVPEEEPIEEEPVVAGILHALTRPPKTVQSIA